MVIVIHPLETCKICTFTMLHRSENGIDMNIPFLLNVVFLSFGCTPALFPLVGNKFPKPSMHGNNTVFEYLMKDEGRGG